MTITLRSCMLSCSFTLLLKKTFFSLILSSSITPKNDFLAKDQVQPRSQGLSSYRPSGASGESPGGGKMWDPGNEPFDHVLRVTQKESNWR